MREWLNIIKKRKMNMVVKRAEIKMMIQAGKLN